MHPHRPHRLAAVAAIALATLALARPARADDLHGPIKSIDVDNNRMVIHDEASQRDVTVYFSRSTTLNPAGGKIQSIRGLKVGTSVIISDAVTASRITVDTPPEESPKSSFHSVLREFWNNFRHNLFKPLLLFFYLGFFVPILRVQFEFPYVMYQALTIYLLIAIGWHGGEELAHLSSGSISTIVMFMGVGFLANTIIGLLAFALLRTFTRMRRVDQATVAGYYGSDSAGTFVTALGVLGTAHVAFDAYMPVMLAVMEIPGCLVALFLVAHYREQGMDALGNLPDEPGYNPEAKAPVAAPGDHGRDAHAAAVQDEVEMSLERMDRARADGGNGRKGGFIDGKLLHEVFLNTGLYLLFGGIAIGFISGLQGPEVTRADDSFFVTLFQGVLCLFLLEMGMTASRKLRDLKTAGWPFVFFGLLAPNLFATIGVVIAHAFAWATGTHFQLGTYVLFSVLCGSASYIAVPAVQRLAIPEASPTLPLAASLGLTFSYNVTIGIPVYMEIAKAITRDFPVG